MNYQFQKEDLDKYLVLSKDHVWRMIDDKAFVVAVDGRKLHGLNKVGSFIWKSADGRHTVRAIVEKICERYEVDKETAERDASEFIAKLIDKGIVNLSDSPVGS